MKLIMIAAVGANRELGKDNDLIWRLREDMKYFKEHTIGHPIVMGRRTYESLPHLLPRRKHIVISRSHPVLPDEVVLYSSVDAFVEAYKNKDEEIYVIGGASIYQQLLPYADELLLTEIDASADADVYFPQFDAYRYRRTVEYTAEEQGIQFAHVRYERKRKKWIV